MINISLVITHVFTVRDHYYSYYLNLSETVKLGETKLFNFNPPQVLWILRIKHNARNSHFTSKNLSYNICSYGLPIHTVPAQDR